MPELSTILIFSLVSNIYFVIAHFICGPRISSPAAATTALLKIVTLLRWNLICVNKKPENPANIDAFVIVRPEMVSGIVKLLAGEEIKLDKK